MLPPGGECVLISQKRNPQSALIRRSIRELERQCAWQKHQLAALEQMRLALAEEVDSEAAVKLALARELTAKSFAKSRLQAINRMRWDWLSSLCERVPLSLTRKPRPNDLDARQKHRPRVAAGLSLVLAQAAHEGLAGVDRREGSK